MTALSASWLIRFGLALLVRACLSGVIVAGCAVVGTLCTLGERLMSPVGGVRSGIARGAVLVILGTSPGVLLRVVRRGDLFVMRRFRLAVGSRAFMIAGAWDTLVTNGAAGGCVVARLTLCSGRGGGVDPSINAVRCRRSVDSKVFPFGVAITVLAVVCSSSVSARKCSFGVRLGTWQCWGNSSAEPDMR